MNWEKHFPLQKMKPTYWEFYHTSKCLTKRPWRYIFLAYVYKFIVLVNEIKRLSFNIVSRVRHYFRFLRTLLITLILDERYMCWSMKIINNSPHKYIAYLHIIWTLLRSGIWWIKSRDLSANDVSFFTVLTF